MLDPQTIAIVKSTVPVLQEHGEKLTQHFYKRLFLHNPEAIPFFNPAHQAAGLQQKALAAAICAYATNIDNLAVLGSAVELIAQKHVSLQIKPEHYPIVGENLLASIREVLGEGATAEVITAWGNAYNFLADLLIGREKQIYDEHAGVPGGWKGFKPFCVMKKEVESDVITSFYLTPKDGSKLPLFKSGQYITLRLPSPDGQTTMRNYSLSDKPGQDWFRISVKRETSNKPNIPDGYASNFLHSHIDVGTSIEVAPPCGEFILNAGESQPRPLILLAAGIGITPILSMLLSAVDTMPKREIIFIHGSLNPRLQAFKKTIDHLAHQHKNLKIHYRYSAVDAEECKAQNTSTGLIDIALIKSMVTHPDGDYYFCGPPPFMTTLYQELLAWGVPATQMHLEFFGPRPTLEPARHSSKKGQCPF